MSNIEKHTVSLSQEDAAYIDRLIASKALASASEVVRVGLRALQERDQAVERSLRKEAAVFDEACTRHASAMRLACEGVDPHPSPKAGDDLIAFFDFARREARFNQNNS